MEFCEKCGGIILVQDNKTACAKCGSRIKKKFKIESSEKIEKGNGIAVINEEKSNVQPIIAMECPKCKNKESYFWTMQTRASDESETKFYKCTKCKYTWRKYR